MSVAPALRPREVRAMRLDEAVSLCLGKMLSQQRSENRSEVKTGGGQRYTDNANGTRTYAINDVATLQRFMATGRV